MILFYIQLNILVKTKKVIFLFQQVQSAFKVSMSHENSKYYSSLQFTSTYLISLRSSSLWEPRYPLLKFYSYLKCFLFFLNIFYYFLFFIFIFIYLKLNKLKKINTIYTPFINDPSAGSPTDTLLRLLLPLDNKVQMFSKKNRVSFLSIIFTGSSNR